MVNLQKKEYDEIKKQRENILDELKLLRENEAVKRYLSLIDQNKDLHNKQLELYQGIKQEEYKSCEHILVYSKIDYDRYEGRTYKSCGCIKCGLDNSVLNYEWKYLPFERQIMYTHLMDNCFAGMIKGVETEVACDLDLAQAIFSKIKEVHPDIDDTTAIKYFEIALDDIRNIKVSDERKVGRAKRLSLKPEFKRWSYDDVCND